MKFKLKAGSHIYRGKDGKDVALEPGGVVETDLDMRKIEGRNRWELLDNEDKDTIEDLKARIRILEGMAPPVEEAKAEVSDDLEGKSISTLRKLAADMEPPVDLTGLTAKGDIIAAIRSAVDNA